VKPAIFFLTSIIIALVTPASLYPSSAVPKSYDSVTAVSTPFAFFRPLTALRNFQRSGFVDPERAPCNLPPFHHLHKTSSTGVPPSLSNYGRYYPPVPSASFLPHRGEGRWVPRQPVVRSRSPGPVLRRVRRDIGHHACHCDSCAPRSS
jgi:hypothetical protein